jgi:hypothetical protein
VTELWLPGRHDDFVNALHRQIARFAGEHGAAVVEVELRDGARLTVSALSAEPGAGFVTLVPHGDESRDVVVPLVAIARVTLAAAAEEHPLGFAVDANSEPPRPS